MALAMIAVFGLISLNVCSGTQSWPELNPALEKYQDLSKCFPLSEAWYSVYRNYESDPAFGGTAKCIKITSNGSPEGDNYPLRIDIMDQSGEVNATLKSSTGYTSKNILSLAPEGSTVLELYTAYVECGQCGVLRTAYINDSTCELLMPESKVDTSIPCCDFIFDLLCGTADKYYTYDASC